MTRFAAFLFLILSLLTLSLNSGSQAQGLGNGAAQNIPLTVEQSVKELEKILSKSELERLRSGPERLVLDYQLSTGMWIRNNWLQAKSPLAEYFVVKQGLFDRDNMSQIMLVSLWRDLHNQPLRLDEQFNLARKNELDSLSSTVPRVKQTTLVPENVWKSMLEIPGQAAVELEHFKGKVIILSIVWVDDKSLAATTFLNSLAAKFPQNKLQIIGLFLSADRQQCDNFLERSRPRFPVVRDSRKFVAELRKQFITGVLTVPTTIVIDKKGSMVSKYNNWDKKASEKSLLDDASKAVRE